MENMISTSCRHADLKIDRYVVRTSSIGYKNVDLPPLSGSQHLGLTGRSSAAWKVTSKGIARKVTIRRYSEKEM
jgi:hypothetical protein